MGRYKVAAIPLNEDPGIYVRLLLVIWHPRTTYAVIDGRQRTGTSSPNTACNLDRDHDHVPWPLRIYGAFIASLREYINQRNIPTLNANPPLHFALQGVVDEQRRCGRSKERGRRFVVEQAGIRVGTGGIQRWLAVGERDDGRLRSIAVQDQHIVRGKKAAQICFRRILIHRHPAIHQRPRTGCCSSPS